MDVVSPDWPHDRIILSADGGAHNGAAGSTWWHVLHSDYSELRIAGFSPAGLSGKGRASCNRANVAGGISQPGTAGDGVGVVSSQDAFTIEDADQSQPLWAALIPASKRLPAPRRSMIEDM